MSVNIRSSLSEITAAWQTFIVDGRPGDYSVTPEIVESWQRCYRAGVNPYDGTCYHFLSQTELADLLTKRKEFVEIARPFMLKLYEFIRHQRYWHDRGAKKAHSDFRGGTLLSETPIMDMLGFPNI